MKHERKTIRLKDYDLPREIVYLVIQNSIAISFYLTG